MKEKFPSSIFLSEDNITRVFLEFVKQERPRCVSLPFHYSLQERGMERTVEGILKMDDKILLPLEMAQEAVRIFKDNDILLLSGCAVLVGPSEINNLIPGPAVRETILVHLIAFVATNRNREEDHHCVCTIGRDHPSQDPNDYREDSLWEPERTVIHTRKHKVFSYRYEKYHIGGEDVFRIRPE